MEEISTALNHVLNIKIQLLFQMKNLDLQNDKGLLLTSNLTRTMAGLNENQIRVKSMLSLFFARTLLLWSIGGLRLL